MSALSSVIVKRVTALALLATASCLAAAGCSAEQQEDVAGGDGQAAGGALVSERQYSGYELPQKTIAFTFDDGPGNRTSELANFLADRGIPATFFINGMRVPGRQGALNTVVQRGHILGNHTQHHLDLATLPPDQVLTEVEATDAFIKQVQPNGPWLIRAPFGSWNANVAHTVNGSDMNRYVGSVFWDAGGVLTQNAAADWDCWGKHIPVDQCANLYMDEIRRKNHGIVLMHDIHDQTIDLVYYILPILQAEGYRFASLPEVPSIKRALAAAPANAGQCQSATLGRAVDENQCVQTRGTLAWWRCVSGDWQAASPTDPACSGYHPLPVSATWSMKSPTATYSLDVQSSNGAWTGPCIAANILQHNLSAEFNGYCPSNPAGSIDLRTLTALRICWAENDDWGNAQCEETPYTGQVAVHVGQ
jgi:peptidoglycan/xylan/chitin deacetylase (PgdA/CDA1 family)